MNYSDVIIDTISENHLQHVEELSTGVAANILATACDLSDDLT